MYPDLSYFFHEVLRTQPDNWTSIFKTFGFLLVMALVVCGFFLKAELKRLELEGKLLPQTQKITFSQQIGWFDILSNVLILVFMASKIPLIIGDSSAFSADPAGVLFSKQGNWLIGLILGGILAAYYIYKNSKLPKESKTQDITFMPSEKTNDIIMIAGLSGVLGSKLFSVFESPADFFKDPLGSRCV